MVFWGSVWTFWRGYLTKMRINHDYHMYRVGSMWSVTDDLYYPSSLDHKGQIQTFLWWQGLNSRQWPISFDNFLMYMLIRAMKSGQLLASFVLFILGTIEVLLSISCGSNVIEWSHYKTVTCELSTFCPQHSHIATFDLLTMGRWKGDLQSNRVLSMLRFYIYKRTCTPLQDFFTSTLGYLFVTYKPLNPKSLKVVSGAARALF